MMSVALSVSAAGENTVSRCSRSTGLLQTCSTRGRLFVATRRPSILTNNTPGCRCQESITQAEGTTKHQFFCIINRAGLHW